MIGLYVEKFCHYCEDFEPTTEKIFSDNRMVSCRVYCKHVSKCRHVAEHIERLVHIAALEEQVKNAYKELKENGKI